MRRELIQMPMRAKIAAAVCAFYALFWVGGVGTYLVAGKPPQRLEWTGAAFLGLAAGLVLALSPRGLAVPLLLVGAVGYGLEVLGVHTGFPFGSYHYTESFGPRLFGVPVVMACAWLVLAAYTQSLARVWCAHRLSRTVLAALWLLAVDTLLDPVAVHVMGHWAWHSEGDYHGIPLSNFLGWGLAAGIVQSLLAFAPGEPRDLYAISFVGLSIVGFLLLLAFAGGLFLPGCAGLVLVLGHGGAMLMLLRCGRLPVGAAADGVSSE